MKIRTFTKNLTLVAAICLFVASANAQPRREKRSAEERAKNQTEQMDKTLTLTADQKSKIEAVNLELAEKADKTAENRNATNGKFREQLQEQETLREAKYKEILTDEQYAKYLKNKEERRKQFGTRGARGTIDSASTKPTKSAKKEWKKQ